MTPVEALAHRLADPHTPATLTMTIARDLGMSEDDIAKALDLAVSLLSGRDGG